MGNVFITASVEVRIQPEWVIWEKKYVRLFSEPTLYCCKQDIACLLFGRVKR
jgi:hypothetical protein